MTIKKIILLLVLFTMAVLTPLASATRVYHEKTEDKTDVHNFTFTKTETGMTVDLTTVKHDGTEIIQQFKLYPSLATWYWEYDCPKKNIRVTASRKDNQITMSGIDRGKKVNKVFNINDLPWNQTFNVGLEKFAQSEKKSMKFWAIGVGGPGNMKITKFKVKRKEFQTITLSNTNGTTDTVHMTISLSGILSIFWTGNYWYRKSDGMFLRYKGKNDRGAPISIMELINSNQ